MAKKKKEEVDHFRSLRRYETSMTRAKKKGGKEKNSNKKKDRETRVAGAHARASSPFILAGRKIRLRARLKMYREQYVKCPVVAQGGTKRQKERKGETKMPREEVEGHRTYGERTGNSFSNGRPYNCECSSRFNRQMGLGKNHVISVIVSRTTSTDSLFAYPR